MLTLTRYEEHLPVSVLFPPHDVVNPLARVISDAGLNQFHCAETEKYPHVTFFLNGGREEPFPGEERVMIQSPMVPTYDLQPEMSAVQVADATIAAIARNGLRFWSSTSPTATWSGTPELRCHCHGSRDRGHATRSSDRRA